LVQSLKFPQLERRPLEHENHNPLSVSQYLLLQSLFFETSTIYHRELLFLFRQYTK
jgi:hypothetical protein